MTQKKKALCLATMASNLDNFNRNNVKILQGLGYDVTLASNFHTSEDINSQEKIDSFIKEMDEDGVHIEQVDFSRRIGNIGEHLKSYNQVKKLINQGFDLIHCHAPICAVITRTCAKKYQKSGRSKVIYTAHGFHFYDGAPLKNWLIFYPIEKYYSKYTDVLITINKEDYKRAKEKFHAKKTVYVPGVGIDMKKFNTGICDKEQKRRELGVKNTEILLFSVGELSTRKNHEVVIKAMAELKNPDIQYFICGQGELESYLKRMAYDLDISEKVHFLGFREDISELCQAADLFVLPSLQEGLPVALMEAIACKTPVICSRIRGNIDLVSGDEVFFNPDNVDELVNILGSSIKNGINGRKDSLREKVECNYKCLQKYDLQKVEKEMKRIYGGGIIED